MLFEESKEFKEFCRRSQESVSAYGRMAMREGEKLGAPRMWLAVKTVPRRF
jgi:hypothetical protein